MATQQTLEGLSELYQGEILGEFLLEGLMLAFTDPDAQQVLGAALQYESETKARLRPVMVRFGLPLTTADHVRADAEAAVAGLKGLSWPKALAAAHASLSNTIVPRFEEIARIAAADGDPAAIEAANYMVIHETALLEMFGRALAGEANPTRGVDALLHFPLPSPA